MRQLREGYCSRPAPFPYSVALVGKQQVARYAKRLERDRGYLIIFDNRVGSPWEERGRFEQHQHDGVEITVLWA
ncbi:MAG: hypothetical protein RBU37_04865 [Myxococcota bacterium]|nr:hypothetical protein [Myxococcota bacterium]